LEQSTPSNSKGSLAGRGCNLLWESALSGFLHSELILVELSSAKKLIQALHYEFSATLKERFVAACSEKSLVRRNALRVQQPCA
jgi:hypothetical protein